jgi:hypothetical protein
VLQVDGYVVYKQVMRADRADGSVILAFCWIQAAVLQDLLGGKRRSPRRRSSALASSTRYEREIRGGAPEVRRAERQARSKPIVEALHPWLEEDLAKISKGSPLAEAIRYGFNHWDGLVRFLDDGRIEIDSNTIERSMKPLALTRKNALFVGHDVGAEIGQLLLRSWKPAS